MITSTAYNPENSNANNASGYPKRLVALDFDYTIVAQNTDTVVRDLLKPESIPSDVRNLPNTEGWTRFMEEIFRTLHKHRIQPEKIRKCIREIPEVPGFVKALKTLHSMNFDLIIISDSNSEFIREWLNSHGLSTTFTEVFTNQAWFEDNGLLRILPYHHQTECKLSAENLCKGKILQEFIQKRCIEGVTFENVFYVGDGTNDICPVLRLSEKDFACPRAGFSMDKALARNKHKLQSKATFLYWKSGFELLNAILNIIKK